MSKFKKDQVVIMILNDMDGYIEWKTGIVAKVLPHPFTPSWLDFIIKPNYLVKFVKSGETKVVKQKELI